MKKAFIIGLGDIGFRVAKLLLAEDVQVSALARSEEKRDRAAQDGISVVTGNLDDPASLLQLPIKDAVVFYFAPPPGGGHTDTRMRSFCSSVKPGNEPAKVVYISTSGVYGDCEGAAVTEETPVNPQTARARRRVDAETALGQWGGERNVDIIILRVTGIYGPGKLPVTQLASGQPVLEERLSPPTNRIHAADLAQVCIAAARKGENGDIFNVSDGQVSTMTHYFTAVADALGLPRPRQVSLEEAREVMSPLMLSYIGESRRMDNGKMLRQLGVTLLYPTLEAGLKATVAEMHEDSVDG